MVDFGAVSVIGYLVVKVDALADGEIEDVDVSGVVSVVVVVVVVVIVDEVVSVVASVIGVVIIGNVVII